MLKPPDTKFLCCPYQVCATNIVVQSSKLRHATILSLFSLPWTYFKSCHALLSLFGHVARPKVVTLLENYLFPQMTSASPIFLIYGTPITTTVKLNGKSTFSWSTYVEPRILALVHHDYLKIKFISVEEHTHWKNLTLKCVQFCGIQWNQKYQRF